MSDALNPEELANLIALLGNNSPNNVQLGLTMLEGLAHIPDTCLLSLFELANYSVKLTKQDIQGAHLTEADLVKYRNYDLAKVLLIRLYGAENTEQYLKGFELIHLGRTSFSVTSENCKKRYKNYSNSKIFFEPLITQYKDWRNEVVYAAYQYIFPNYNFRSAGYSYTQNKFRALSKVELHTVLLVLEPVIRAEPEHFYANILIAFTLNVFNEKDKNQEALFFWQKALKTANSVDWDAQNQLSLQSELYFKGLYNRKPPTLLAEFGQIVTISYIYHRLCLTCDLLNKQELLQKYAEEAIQKLPEDINTPYYLLGLHYYNYGLIDKAIQNFEKGVNFYQKKHHLYKTHPRSNYYLLYDTVRMAHHLADIYINNKEDVAKAMQYYGLSVRFYTELSPQHPQLQAILVRQLIIVIHIYKDYWQAQHLIDKLRKANKYHPAIQKYKYMIKEKTRFS